MGQRKLFIKESQIPGAGKGLFTRSCISMGTRITEYRGDICTWRKVLQLEKKTGTVNPYLFYVRSNYVIDAMYKKQMMARYANDAHGPARVKGLSNNCEYEQHNSRVYMVAQKDIHAGSELLIGYGKEYWEGMKTSKNK